MRITAYILAVCALAAAPAYCDKASDEYKKARKLEKAGHVIEAYLLYTDAATLQPKNAVYAAKAAELKGRADAEQLKNTPSSELSPAELATTPDPNLTSISAHELESARQMLPPAELKLATGRYDFHFHGTTVDLFNQVAARCGLQTVFDSEYQQTPVQVRFDIDDVDCREAIHAAEAASASFVAPLSSKLILVSKDSTMKRQANEQTMSVVIPVPTALTTQDLTEISQAVKQVAGIEKLAWSAATHEIVIRDRVSRVRIATPLVEQLTAFRGEVMFDLRFLQMSDTELLQYGVDLTNTFNFIWGNNPLVAQAGAPLNVIIRALQHGTHVFGITALEASVVATMSKSTSRTVLRTQIRALNGMPATLHVGDKYPILTSGYYGPPSASTASNGQSAYTPPPSFTYQDLGVSLKVIPMIGNDDLISLDVDTEYQLLAGEAIDGIPVLANRHMTTRISIHNNEWALIGGLMDRTDSKSISGVAGLANLPIFGPLFRTTNREKDRDHIIIVMRPHIVGEPPSNNETAPMRVGSETRPLSPI